MRPAATLGLALAAAWLAASGALAVERVPRPEFDTGYRPPATTAPEPPGALREAVDVALLVGSLALAGHLAVTRRSRSGLVALSVVAVAYFGFLRHGCVCPIGSIQNVALALADRSVLLPAAAVAVFVAPLAFALWRGRVFCAGVCPAGALQNLVLLRPVAIPAPVSASLGLGRHVYLGLAVLAAATGSAFVICEVDPFVALFRLGGTLPHLLLGGAFLGLATVVARPYCRFLCPYGVLLGAFARLASRRATTCPATCITCRLCESACPAQVIERPTAGTAPESLGAGVRRLAVLLALAPVAAGAGGWAVSRLDVVLARLHPVVRLAERVALEDSGGVADTTLESRAFRSGGRPASELAAEAHAIRGRFRLGGFLLGGYLGLVTVLTLIRHARWRRRTAFSPDAASCFACGRCFASCPQEHAIATEVPAHV